MTEHLRRAHLRGIFTRIIQAEHSKRPERAKTINLEPEWVELERVRLLHEVNAHRGLFGKKPIERDIFDRLEQTCAGHIDYASKLCMACVELVIDRQ
jgi:hypothetical protein